MSGYIIPIILLAMIGTLMIYVPRLIQKKQRGASGVVLLIVGYGALTLGMRLEDRPFLQNAAVAYAWLSVCILCMLAGMISLLSWRR